MARHELCGRAADVFSLGCVLLEILVLHNDGTLQRLRAHHRLGDLPVYHTTLDAVDEWLPLSGKLSARRYNLHREVRSMLSSEADQRPAIDQILSRVTLADAMMPNSDHSIFGACCRSSHSTVSLQTTQAQTLRERTVAMELLRGSHVELDPNGVLPFQEGMSLILRQL